VAQPFIALVCFRDGQQTLGESSLFKKILVMKELHANLTRTTTRLASVIAGLIAFSLPLAFFTMALQSNLAAMNEEAKYNAANVSRLISANPQSWQLDEPRLHDLIKDITETDLPESRRIVDNTDRVIIQSFESTESPGSLASAEAAEALNPLNPLAIMRTADLIYSDDVVGQFQVIRNVRPLLLETALVSLLGLFMGAMVLLVLRIYPLRALKATLATLANEKERAEFTLHAIGDAVVTIDGEGTVQSFNPAAEKIFGYAAAEVIGHNMKMLIPEAYRKKFDNFLRRFPNTGEAYLIGIEREVRARRSDSELVPVDLRISEFYLDGRRQLIGSMRDTTERKRARKEILQLNANLEARVEERTAQLRCANEQLRIASEQLRLLAAHQESVREAERTRIAHELHDELGGLLTAAKFDLGRLGPTPGGIAPERIDKLRDSLDAAIGSTRAIIADLRPPVIDQLGLWGAIEWYAAELANRRGLRCRVVVAPELEEVNPSHDVSISLFRIVQEALSNIVKHAEASAIIVTVRCLATGLVEVEVTDDGKGLCSEDLAKAGHWGVMGMRERVHSHSGELTLESFPGSGTTLRATLRID
jgi:PAS domain S-box-containing protein